MFANLIPLIALLFGIILGMGMFLFIVRWAFEYERKLIIYFMEQEQKESAINNVLMVPKKNEDENEVDTFFGNYRDLIAKSKGEEA